MPALSAKQQEDVSRRSTRLTKNSALDDDAASTSSTGSTGQISYRESPVRVFKKKTGGRRTSAPPRTSTITNESQNRKMDDVVEGKGATVRSPAFQTLGKTSASPISQMEHPGFSSGYSSSEEGPYAGHPKTTTPFSSSKNPSTAQFGFKDVMNSPAHAFAMLYFWLGTAWYTLTSGMSLMNVLLLSRCTAEVKKILIIILLVLLMCFGLWFWFPSVTTPHTQQKTPIQRTYTPAFAAMDDHDPDLKEKLFAELREIENRWVKDSHRQMEDIQSEIALLKKDEEKQKLKYEDLKAQVRSIDTEHRKVIKQEISGVQSQMSELRTDMSNLRNDFEKLNQRMETQESQSTKLKTELSDWLLQQIAGSDRSESDVVMRPDLQRLLEELEKKIIDKVRIERDADRNSAWRTVGETLTQEGVGSMTVKDVEGVVHRALSLYRAGGIGMADYALESSGASVINTRCSETFHTKTACVSLFGFPLWYQSESPRTVIQPEIYPGKCWPFRGSQGFLVISLSHPVQITHVTLEHLPRVLSPTGNINSAPKDFTVYGLLSEDKEEGKLLGTFTYDQDGEPVQTFQVQESDDNVYHLVELRILSNWGHPEYTCVYRFRVHGHPQND